MKVVSTQRKSYTPLNHDRAVPILFLLSCRTNVAFQLFQPLFFLRFCLISPFPISKQTRAKRFPHVFRKQNKNGEPFRKYMEYVEQPFGRRTIKWVRASQGIYSVMHDRQAVYGNNGLRVLGSISRPAYGWDVLTRRMHSRVNTSTGRLGVRGSLYLLHRPIHIQSSVRANATAELTILSVVRQ